MMASNSAGRPRPPAAGAFPVIDTSPASISSRVTAVTVAGDTPRRAAMWLREIGPSSAMTRSTPARLRSPSEAAACIAITFRD